MTPVAAAILALWTLPNGHYVRACGQDCELRAAHVEHAVEGAAIVFGVEEGVLIAVGFLESSLLGRENTTSRGYWGMHRRSRLWRECSAPCDVEDQALVAAGELKRLAAVCGSLEGALSAWRTGRCESETGQRYARRVVALAGRVGGNK